MNPMVIKIKIGELGSHFLQRNNLPEKGSVNKQPAGLNFYRHNWSSSARGTVFIEHGAYSFQIPHALSILGTEDVELMEQGLAVFNINSGMAAASPIMHNDARLEFMAVLEKLLALGWKPFVSYDYPRLTGEQAFKFFLEDDNYGVPVNYIPTLDEWMHIRFGYWCFYADDVFLEINFQRDKTKMNPNELGAYLFSFELTSKDEEAKSNFQGDDRNHWQDLWVDKIKSMKQERYEKEAELIKRGFTIYTDYDEPKIHPADPVEP